MLLIQNLSTAPKIATRKLIVERNGGKSSRKTRRKREESQNQEDMEKAV